MLADNITYLKQNDFKLYEALKKRETNPEISNVFLEDTKNGFKTLRIEKNNRSVLLHSKYDPQREAEVIINLLERREAITPDTHVIFYGLGLGFHIDAFIKRYPNNNFSIFEPSVECLIDFLGQIQLRNYSARRLKYFQGEYDSSVLSGFIRAVLTNASRHTIVCCLPSYQSIFEKEYQKFLNQFRDEIKITRNVIHTNYAYKKRWIVNSLINFKDILHTPNILIEHADKFKGKKAILVSAGPSLDYEIKNLKLIKEKGLAYIFCVGSAINTLTYNDIKPDAMCTFDPTELNNQLVFKKINELKIDTVPMIFGTSVGFEVLQNYNGPKFHMITTQDTIGPYFLKRASGLPIELVRDAPTIAIVTLELLHILGFEEIILVGQNLAYLNKKNYAEGIEYYENQEINESESIKAEDVTGNSVYTTDTYLSMKRIMESYIEAYKMNVTNTTRGGIKIEGTKYMELDQVIIEKLKSSIVNAKIFEEICQTDLYDHDYLETQYIKMEKALESYMGLLAAIRQQLIKTEELIINKNEKQATYMHKKLDDLIKKLEANDFAIVFAFPMNRVEYVLLAKKIEQVKLETNELKKIGELITLYKNFVNLLYNENQLNQEIIGILKKDVQIEN